MNTETSTARLAPELTISQWFNSAGPIKLQSLRGRVVLLHAFQILCPGCVSHGTPQAEKIHCMFKESDITVIGLHTVFEHHAAMTPVSLEAFLHEYRVTFPVGVDAVIEGSPIPATMQRYQLRGTPSSVLIGRDGFIRYQGFGQEDDLALGALIGTLLAEKRTTVPSKTQTSSTCCDDGACVAPQST